MKKIINNTLITLLLTLLAFTNVMSQVDSSFTYQGELLDNGSPANGQYDINIDLIDGDMNPWGSTSVHSPVEVTNGLFSVNTDFGIVKFDGFRDFTVTVSIRKSSEGPGGAFTVLGSQTIQAVPLATNLTNGDATSGQVLTFNGFQWNPADPVVESLPWTINGSSLYYTSGNVGIGTSSPGTALDVETNQGWTANFNGGNNMFVFFEENGQGRGYIGSFQTPNASQGINDNDFEIGTTGGSSGNLHLVTGSNDPAVTIDSNGTSKFLGDTKQELASNGMMKYMVDASCSDSGANITKFYNGINSDNVTITDGAADGNCIVNFPTDISNRYYQVSAQSPSVGASGVRGATCFSVGGGNSLTCARFNTTTGNGINGSIMILVY